MSLFSAPGYFYLFLNAGQLRTMESFNRMLTEGQVTLVYSEITIILIDCSHFSPPAPQKIGMETMTF